jgi:hypothetical protein
VDACYTQHIWLPALVMALQNGRCQVHYVGLCRTRNEWKAVDSIRLARLHTHEHSPDNGRRGELVAGELELVPRRGIPTVAQALIGYSRPLLSLIDYLRCDELLHRCDEVMAAQLLSNASPVPASCIPHVVAFLDDATSFRLHNTRLSVHS